MQSVCSPASVQRVLGWIGLTKYALTNGTSPSFVADGTRHSFALTLSADPLSVEQPSALPAAVLGFPCEAEWLRSLQEFPFEFGVLNWHSC